MGRYVCVANQTSGVGKTTTTINLAIGLARGGCQTLVIDLDPACDTTFGLGGQPAERHPLVGEEILPGSIWATGTDGLALLPGNRLAEDLASLSGAEEDVHRRLRAMLTSATESYDFVLIDCPPSLGGITETALFASTEVLLPIRCDYFALEGVPPLIQVVRKAMRGEAGRLRFGGILLTMHDNSLDLARDVDKEVREFFGEIVFDTVIPRDRAISAAPRHQGSVIDHAPRTRGARAYVELCMEVLERE